MTLRIPHRASLSGLDLGPTGDAWQTLPTTTYDLVGTPTGAVDSSKYVMQAVDGEAVGAVDRVEAAGVHDGDRLIMRLSWADTTCDETVADGTDYVDKAAIAFPLVEGASVMTMGSKRAPVNAWYWRADRCVPLDVLAMGYGDVNRREPTVSGLGVRADYRDDRWHVVFRRSLTAEGHHVDFTRHPHAAAVAVWDGANAERGPLKAYSGEFTAFELEGVS